MARGIAAALVALAMGRAWAQSAGGDIRHETPSGSQHIALGMGRVDAVTGDISLRAPLGPRLPGRIPLGFSWSYLSSSDRPGAIRPVSWPDKSSTPLQTTVVVDGEPWAFYPQAAPAAGSLPSVAEVQALLTARGVDLGEGDTFLVLACHPSSDGTRFFFRVAWQVESVNSHGDPIFNTVFPKMVVLDRDTAVWTALQADLRTPTGPSYFTNRWGDKVSVTETGSVYGAPTSIVIKNERYPSHTLTMSVAPNGTPSYGGTSAGFFSGSQVTVTHTLGAGLPSQVQATGTWWAIQRVTYVPPGSPDGYTPTGVWDTCFIPTQIQPTGGDGNTPAPTTLVWPTTYSFFHWPTSITYPSGLTETFTYAGDVSRLSNDAYDPDTGYWRGYRVLEHEGCGLGCAWAEQVVNEDGTGLSRITRSGAGVGETVFIARQLPRGVKGALFQWTQKLHATSILRYASASPVLGTDPYRGVRLTHPGVDSWLPAGANPDVVGNFPGATTKEAYLFASSVILASESITGTQLDGGQNPTGYTAHQITQYDGWDLRSWANPTGSLSNGLPVNPVALRTQVFSREPGVSTASPAIPAGSLPAKITLAGIGAGARDAWGPVQTDEYTTATLAFPGTPSGNGVGAWWDALSLPTGLEIHRRGKITRHLDRAVWALLTDTDQKTLDGAEVANERFAWNGSALQGIASADFGTTTYAYGSGSEAGLVKTTTGARGGYTATESRAYFVNASGVTLPLVTLTTKTLTGPNGAIKANPDAGTDPAVGEESQYDATPFAWRSAKRDRVDGRWTTYTRDGLGRETSAVDPLGITVSTAYDGWGRVASRTRAAKGAAGALATAYAYDPNGLWKQETTTGEGRILSAKTTLDGAGRPTRIDKYAGSALLEYQTIQYDGWGQKVAESPFLKPGQAPYGNTTTIYDPFGRVIATADPQGRPVSKALQLPLWQTRTADGATFTGLWSQAQDAGGYSRWTALDLLGQMRQTVDQAGQISSCWYDQDGRLIRTLQGAQERKYAYNAMGWLLGRTEPEEGATLFDLHTMLGTALRSTQQGRSGSGTWVTRTTLGSWLLPIQVQATGSEGAVTRTLAYDANHLLTTLGETQAYGTLAETYAYDDLARLSQKTVSDGSQSFTISRALDAFGNVVSESLPAAGGRPAQTITRAYDGANRPLQVLLDGANRALMAYDQVNGTAVSALLAFGNGATTRSKVDRGELALTEHAVVNGNGYLSGNLESNALTWTAGGLLLQRGGDSFSYDALQRLASATVAGLNAGETATQQFTYDRWGNRVSSAFAYSGPQKPKELLAWSYAPSGSNDLPASLGTPGGSVPTLALYDDLGRMTQVNAVPGAADEFTTWTYDPTGRVMSETINGVASTFLLDGEGLRFRRTKGDGTVDYTIYGFNREPLSSFEYKPQVVTASQSFMASAASWKPKHSKIRPMMPIDDGGGGGGATPAGAVITSPASNITVYTGQTVAFGAYTDYGVAFSWNFGDGSPAVTGATTASHAFSAAGSFTARFTASASGYMTSSATVVINVVAPPPSINSFTASATTIPQGGGTTLSWSASNATSLSISGIGTVTGTSLVVSPSATTIYTLTASGPGGSASSQVTVNVVQPPSIAGFWASPSSIYQGDASTLSWTASSATSLSLNNGIGAVTGTSRTVNPSATTAYTLTATNTLNGVSASATATVTVTVSPRPTVPAITSFTADASAIAAGNGTALRWSVSNGVGAVNVTLNGSAVSPAGSQNVAPSATAAYTLVAANSLDPSKSVSASVTVTVVQKPVISFTANTATVYAGSPALLSWSVANGPTSLSIDQGIGAVAASGSTSVSPAGTATYTLTASNLAGTSTAQVTVAVTPQPAIVSFSASAAQIAQGGSVTLSWAVQGATGLTLNGVPVTGSGTTAAPSVTTTYTLVASNPAGTASQSVAVTVVIPATFSWQRTLVHGFGQLLSEERPTGTVYIQSDHVGSPNLLTDASGTVVGRSKNLPFGERYGQLGAEKSARRFTNHEDQPGSAIYMQARTYLPVYGKFAQVDPAYDQAKDDPESWNLYGYVTNNPVTKTDPDGRMVSLNKGQMAMLASSGSAIGNDGALWTLYENGMAIGVLTLPGGDSKNRESQAIAAQTQANTAPGNAQTAQENPAGTTTNAWTAAKTGATLVAPGTLPQPTDTTATVALVSRDIDTSDMTGWKKALSFFEHAGLLIETKGASFVVQSGPGPDGKNTAWDIKPLPQGESMKSFGTLTSGGQTRSVDVHVIGTFQVDAASVTREKLQGLANTWNAKNLTYNPTGPNSNTFAHWYGQQLGLSGMPRFGMSPPLPGWTSPLP